MRKGGKKNSSNEIKRRMKFKPGRSARSRAIGGKQEQVCFVWEVGGRGGVQGKGRRGLEKMFMYIAMRCAGQINLS